MSTDGGASWQRAHLHGPNRALRAGCAGRCRGRRGGAGRTELLARATDADGLRQPDRVPFNCEGYMF